MSKTKILDEQMIKNITGYEVETIENFVDAVRKTVGQYLGYVGNKGYINMIREIFQNSIDELMKEASPCDSIKVSFDERTKIVIIEDNGRGLPFNDIIRIFTKQHTSSNYTKKEGEFSSGRHGVGSKVVNAVSEYFIAESYVLGEGRIVTFEDGKPNKDGVVVIKKPAKYQGSIITFKPSLEVMGDITTTYKDVLKLVQSILPLTKIGAVIEFNAIDSKGVVIKEKLINQDGIITDLVNKVKNPLIKPIIMNKVTGRMKADIAFTYDSDDLGVEQINSFSNFCPTISGKHVDGFIDSVTRFFRDYMNKIFLSSNSKLTIANMDIKTGLKAIIHVAHLEPIFTGQAKEILSNEDMFYFVRNLVQETLDQWIKENPNELQKLCKYFKDIAEVRVKSDEGKIKLSTKYQTSLLSGMPKKYVKPNGKEHLELIILEGDSALGSTKNSRCHARQGLFPIRGKILNAMEKSKAEMLGNQEIASMLTIIGGGYGKNFDIQKCPWEKIIILCDADPDGAHIRSLLFKFLLIYCQPLITNGRVYGAVPPLFGIKQKNGKFKYFTDKLDYIKYSQSLFNRDNKLAHNLTHKQMTNNETIEILFRNMEYAHELEIISNTFAINPLLLEFCLFNYTIPFKDFKKVVEKQFRFITVKQNNNLTVLEGLYDSKYQTIVFNDKLLNSCIRIINMIENSPNYYYMNDKLVSLYQVMKAFDDATPSGLVRYKGIGEMNSQQVAESALHPDSDRMLIRFTLEDIQREIEEIRYLESNKYLLLKDVKVTKSDIL